jgi:hypothetical protein
MRNQVLTAVILILAAAGTTKLGADPPNPFRPGNKALINDIDILKQQSKVGPFEIVEVGKFVFLLDVTSGKTWVLSDSVNDEAGYLGWLAMERIDDQQRATKFLKDLLRDVKARSSNKQSGGKTVSAHVHKWSSRGRVELKGESVTITYRDDRVERWTPVGDRMVVEHWYPASKVPVIAPVLGIGERIK